MRASLRALRRADRSRRWCAALAVALAVPVAQPALASAAHHHHAKAIGSYDRRDLVSDVAGRGEITDTHLKNAWGLGFGPATPAWVADNGTGVSTLYNGATSPTTPPSMLPLVVTIPGGAPTGLVFNPGTGFVVHSGAASGAARFLFSSEKGTITGWSPTVPAPGSTQAQTAVTVKNAIFKGLAIAGTPQGMRIYAADFHHGKVDVWDESFNQIKHRRAFRDRRLPRRYAPFGIQAVGSRIVVTYAKQDADREDESAGPGRGFVDVFNTNGRLLRRFARRGALNAPWGVALAPAGFGAASGALLIGNFGDGRILAYSTRGRFLGALRGADGRRLRIDGLWALEFGNGVIGTPQTLLFTAGPNDEQNGLFGAITAH